VRAQFDAADFESAVVVCQEALKDYPGSEGLWLTQGKAFASLNRPAQAVECFGNAVAIEPISLQGWVCHGHALLAMSAAQRALVSFNTALLIDPDHAPVYSGMASAYHKLGEARRALKAAMNALANNAQDINALRISSEILLAGGHEDKALYYLEKLAEVQGETNSSTQLMGVAYYNLDRFEAAIDCYDRVLARQPDHHQARGNRAAAVLALGQVEECVSELDIVLAADPEASDARLTRGVARLTLGEFPSALDDLAARWKRPEMIAVKRSTGDWPHWRGEDLNGKHIVLYAEQGLGDSLQFIRLIELVAKPEVEITLAVPTCLHRLFRDSGITHKMVDHVTDTSEFDYQCPILDIPWILDLTVEELPQKYPYLHANPVLVAKWAAQLPKRGLNVGIVWQGNPNYRFDALRSPGLAPFEALAGVPGVNLISLQQRDGMDQLEDPAIGIKPILLEAVDAEGDAFVDTAAIMQKLDLIISSDTAMVHLAGALNCRIWVAINRYADWRWLEDREDTPWYPKMRLFRQKEQGDWQGVFDEIAAALASECSKH
jgi:tetratricopeptide (TPR) repeat protein